MSSKATDVQQFESSLERDHLRILEFDPLVHTYEVQPVTINYSDSEGKLRKYTPDVLIHFRQDIKATECIKPKLCEVKYRCDLKENWAILKPKFRAAIEYAKTKDWEFRIITEREIRTDYLFNATFLLRYKNAQPESKNTRLLLDRIKELQVSTPSILIASFNPDKITQGELIYTLWCLVSHQQIACNLHYRINMESAIWVAS